MKKDIAWLKAEVEKQDIVMDKGYIYTSDLLYLIDKLDESKVLSQEGSISIVLNDLKEYIKEQQSLSQIVGLAHTPTGNDTHYKQYDYVLECINEYEPSDELQNLLVPKQELPVIPKYVAEWIEAERGTMSNWKLPSRFISDSKYKKDQRRYKWSQLESSMDKFMSALINGYEVEETPLLYAKIKGHEVTPLCYWNLAVRSGELFVSDLKEQGGTYKIKITKEEWNELGIDDGNADFEAVQE